VRALGHDVQLGQRQGALFVKGSPNAPNPCPIQVATAIPMSITRTTTGDRLSFTIPQNLKTPLATIRNSLVETQLTLLRKTVRQSGRTVGYFETIGGCRSGSPHRHGALRQRGQQRHHAVGLRPLLVVGKTAAPLLRGECYGVGGRAVECARFHPRVHP
jgi:hypothetical protein